MRKKTEQRKRLETKDGELREEDSSGRCDMEEPFPK